MTNNQCSRVYTWKICWWFWETFHGCENVRWNHTEGKDTLGDAFLQEKAPFVLRLYVLTQESSALEKAMAPHSSTLAWKIPWTEEPGGPQSMGSQRVRHDWATSLSFFSHLSLSQLLGIIIFWKLSITWIFLLHNYASHIFLHWK